MRCVGEQLVHHAHGVVAIAHAEMDVDPEDGQSPGNPLLALEHALVSLTRIGHAVAIEGERVSSSPCHHDAEVAARCTQLGERSVEIAPYLREVLADTGSDLNHRAEDLGPDRRG